MKYAIVLAHGAADEAVADLDGLTPLQAANTPNIDWISTNGRQGRVVTVPRGFLPGSDVATLSLLGYDPRTSYSGRAPLEALARGIKVDPDAIIFRCNFVTITDGRMADFTAGHICQAESERLIADLNDQLSPDGCWFHAGVSYRNLLVCGQSPSATTKCTPPHDIPDQPIANHLPRGEGSAWINRICEQARQLLTDHDVNHVRRDLGENPATDIWLWGQGRVKELEGFEARFGVKGAVIGAVDLIRGLARSMDMDLIDVPGATGYLDTNYEGKGHAASMALDEYDLIVVHVEAPDEAGHLGDVAAKVASIERIDERIVGPVLERLRCFAQWKIMIAPDHPTPVEKRVHTDTPPPFCVAGHTVQPVLCKPFSESTAAQSDLQVDPGFELMEFFLRA